MSLIRTAALAGALLAGFGIAAEAQQAPATEPATPPTETPAPTTPATTTPAPATETQPGPAPAPAHEAEGGAPHFPLKIPAQLDWSFAGPFGNFDQGQLQRGFQVYREVCSLCHSLSRVAFRTLADPGGPGFTEDQVKSLAAEYTISDGPNDEGKMFDRPGRPSDHFPPPFPNEQAAAAANNGAPPPDLSLMAKARGIPRGPLWTVLDFFTQYQEAGPDYIHGLLTGFQDPPPGVTIPEGTHYNPYFANAASLAMPPPLTDELVKYSDGAPQTVDQYSKDVAAFLMWTAEPHLVARKRLGFSVFLFLIVFGGLMYLTKKRVWANVPH
jgi:ubiquinol-cytochrome c reductase cytochrome c1 subunit